MFLICKTYHQIRYIYKKPNMRNLIMVFAVLIAIVSCNKDKNSNSAGVVIKGKIKGNTVKGA
jgi:hypothetical protein